jgi:hypothetical protein
MLGISQQVPSSVPTASDLSRTHHTQLSAWLHSNSMITLHSSSFQLVTEASLASLVLLLPIKHEEASGSLGLGI